MGEMTHIDLFSGIGGFAMAARWAGFKTVAFVEIEPYAQETLKQNFGAVADAEIGKRSEPQAGNGREVFTGGSPKIFGDIFAFNGTPYRGATLLTGGFPCQPFSQAGKRRGKEDDRYLWPEMLRVIHDARPAWVLGENVAGIVTMELDRVLSDLEGEGYAVQAIIIPACAVDAKHRRDRVWIVGYANGAGCRESHAQMAGWQAEQPNSNGEPDTNSERKQREGSGQSADTRDAAVSWESGRVGGERARCEWATEPGMDRVAHGIPSRVDRLKGLGNAIVPQVAFEILKGIAEIEK